MNINFICTYQYHVVYCYEMYPDIWRKLLCRLQCQIHRHFRQGRVLRNRCIIVGVHLGWIFSWLGTCFKGVSYSVFVDRARVASNNGCNRYSFHNRFQIFCLITCSIQELGSCFAISIGRCRGMDRAFGERTFTVHDFALSWDCRR